MEFCDVYDIDRIKTGKTAVRGERLNPGEYRLVVHVCVFDMRGRMLIQQRQPFIRGWPGRWDVTVGGGVAAGETSCTAAERELFEEIGLRINFSGMRACLTKITDNVFDDFYIIKADADISALKLQHEEVQRVKWAMQDEILELVQTGEFVPYEKSFIELLFKIKNGV